MIRSVTRIVIAMLLGALAGAAGAITAVTVQPEFVVEMDRHLPAPAVSGFYPPERAGDLTFAWTSRRAEIALAGLDRRRPWICVLRFRGDGPALQRTAAIVDADGVTLERAAASLAFQELRVTIPARPERPGLTLGITSSATFVPGPSDRRELGLLVDSLVCRPDGGGLSLPPRRATGAAAAAAAVSGAALGAAGVALGTVALAMLLLAIAQGVLLSSGLAAYGDFPATLLWSAGWIAAIAIVLAKGLETWTGRGLSPPAGFALFFSAAALHLKLLGLFHPSKLLIDALFHAHRLEWVLAGRYYFTQPLPSGVTFPYAIGLYVFAAPWTLVVSDYVSLLRAVVIAAEVMGGLLLYPLIVKTWGHRLTAAAAVALFHAIPLPYGLIGNANLTNAFGQSVALMALVAAALGACARRRYVYAVGLWLLTSLAFLSHISTFAQLFAILIAAAAMYRWKGGAELRPAATVILVVALLAGAFATVAYYGHFGEVYRTALRVRAQAAAAPAQGIGAPAEAISPQPAASAMSSRFADAAGLTATMMSLPVLILAVVGAWSLWTAGARDALTLLLAAWGTAYLAFFAVGVVPAVDAPFQRYAAEFVGRVNFAAYPAAAVLASRGAIRLWQGPRIAGIAAVVLVLSALVSGARHWAGWFL